MNRKTEPKNGSNVASHKARHMNLLEKSLEPIWHTYGMQKHLDAVSIILSPYGAMKSKSLK